VVNTGWRFLFKLKGYYILDSYAYRHIMRRGFTLLELIVVIIIIGILATVGFSQYTRMVEKGRAAEAKIVLGQIRTAQVAYNQENGAYATDLTLLAVVISNNSCDTVHYFSYTANATVVTATRCGAGGKTPNYATAYTVNVNYDTGVLGGSAGYY